MKRFLLCSTLSISALVLAVGFGGCSSKEEAGPTGPAGGPVAGAADKHCGTLKQATSEAACNPPKTDAGPSETGSDAATDAPAPAEDAHDHDHDAAEETSDPGDPGDEYGATLNNAEGDDDQCKYHASFTVDPVRIDQDIYFTITAKTTVDGKGLVGAKPRIEAFLDETHPAPNTDQKPVAVSDGVYKVGPIRFDAAGTWTVRFHFYEDCVDGDESPHGHVAFFIKVP